MKTTSTLKFLQEIANMQLKYMKKHLYERLNEPKMYPWLQRGIHIYDPDGHLVEVSESMHFVAFKHF